ncbi:sugar transferase [Caulobacter sp. BK020]|uniref:sugar transferase n=1 Tax=Caulobacter sp. BK020 TaxID=2512117 RepID=UPI001045B9E2|nr:sugar transferase [Caulobacter sp. BK020]TCS14891.1 lipopolysaccharide/colanic/teichoic acid biosynthesis glycosyltransferase [Caulobacter sp. BK020]
MAKRLFDVLLSLAILILVGPILAVLMALVWAQDGRSPLFLGVRVGRDGRDFRMVKLRSMTADSEFKGAASTTRSDARITPLGHVLRRWKLDELPQFWNVLRGQMSVVGPRPNTRRGGVDLYTTREMGLLSVRPGITDLASILFADEAEILDGAADPDALYDQVIRPWKSRLGLLYIERRTFWIDLRIIALTALGAISHAAALEGVDAILEDLGASDELRLVCRRGAPLPRAEPPGYAA